jgi:type IV fimbrial biogenesis protein FimT
VRSRGFTLIETMVVVAIVAVVGAVAGPSLRTFVGTMNSKAAAFDLINDLTAARSEAIKRNAGATVVPVSGDWANGWTVRDANGNLLRSRDALGSSLSVGTAPAGGVAFLANGRLAADTVDANVAWSISSSISGVTARCVVISPTGSARSKNGSCS